MKIELQVRNIGPVPSFKNTKSIGRNRKTKRPFIMTDPKKKKWMGLCTESFELQLFCATQISGAGTLTAPPPHSLIVSSLPLDDSRQWIPELMVSSEDCPKGDEGATIIIEPV